MARICILVAPLISKIRISIDIIMPCGDNAVSVFWNLYWQEQRGDETAWELSMIVSYRSTKTGKYFRLLKGLL